MKGDDEMKSGRAAVHSLGIAKRMLRGFRSTSSSESKLGQTRLFQMTLAILVSFGFFLLACPSNAAEPLAIVRLTGTAVRNGLPLLDGGVVFSGDVVTTDSGSVLQVAPSLRQRVWLGPDSSAKLAGNGGNLVVAIGRGTVRFAGRKIRVTVDGHDFTLGSRGTSPVVGQLTLVNRQQAQVWLKKGTLELEQGGRSVALRADQSGSFSVVGADPAGATPTPKAASQVKSGRGTIKGTVVNTTLFVVPNATVKLVGSPGGTFTTSTDNQGAFILGNIPPGTYTLTVSHSGYKNYEKANLVVTGEQSSSLYIELSGGRGPAGGSGGHKALVVGVVIGGAAAAGVGAWVAMSHSNKTVSPTVP